MAYKLMHIPNEDAQKYPYCRLHLGVETFGHSTNTITISKVVKPTKKKKNNIKLWVLV